MSICETRTECINRLQRKRKSQAKERNNPTQFFWVIQQKSLMMKFFLLLFNCSQFLLLLENRFFFDQHIYCLEYSISANMWFRTWVSIFLNRTSLRLANDFQNVLQMDESNWSTWLKLWINHWTFFHLNLLHSIFYN